MEHRFQQIHMKPCLSHRPTSRAGCNTTSYTCCSQSLITFFVNYSNSNWESLKSQCVGCEHRAGFSSASCCSPLLSTREELLTWSQPCGLPMAKGTLGDKGGQGEPPPKPPLQLHKAASPCLAVTRSTGVTDVGVLISCRGVWAWK